MSLNKIKVNNTTTVNTGVVYDISKETGQSYDDLKAALGTNGNNVPPEVREGGMSIRFVSNSSDNKYLQFRLKTTKFSTTVTDWESENADDTPTENSPNLVKSGGVVNAIEAAKNKNLIEEASNDNTLYVIDPEGNVVAKINTYGIKAVEFIIKNGQTLTELLSGKVDVVEGKVLSSNDYTNQDKSLLASLAQMFVDYYGYAFCISDIYGNIIARFDNTGLTITDILALLSDGLFIADKLGNLGFKYDKDGLDANALSQHLLTYIQNNITMHNAGNKVKDIDNIGADINMFICYGQSLSNCAANNNKSTNYPVNILQFDSNEEKIAGGIRVVYQDYDSPQVTLDEYYGGALIHAKNTGWEGSLKKMCWTINEMLSFDNGIDAEAQNLLMLGIAPGISGSGIENLTKYPVNASYIYAYERLLESVRQAQKKAAALNKSFMVPALFWVQGESNYNNVREFDEQTHTWGNQQTTTPALYKTAMAVLFNQLNTDIKFITGQTKDVQFILYQPATFATCAGRGISTYVDETTRPVNASVAKAMLDMALDDNYPNVHWGGAMYQYAYCSTDLHPTVSSTNMSYGSIPYEHMGAVAGIQAKRVCFGGEAIKPILPKSHIITHVGSKYIVDIEFNVQFGPLVLDESAEVFHNPYSVGISNYGFEIKNGNSIDIVSNVSVSRMNHVTITCSENPAGLTLTYARNGIGFTESQGAGKNMASSNILFKTGGGCLRDSQGDIIKVRIGESKIGIYNFAPIFDYTL